MAGEECAVDAHESSFPQRSREAIGGFRPLRDDHQTGGVSIESMNEPDVISTEVFAAPVDQIRISRFFTLRKETCGLRKHDEMRILEINSRRRDWRSVSWFFFRISHFFRVLFFHSDRFPCKMESE